MILKKRDKFLSIRMVRFLMKIVGFWPAESKIEKRLLNGLLSYTILICIIGVWIETTELYLGKGDFYVSIEICNNKRSINFTLIITLIIG